MLQDVVDLRKNNWVPRRVDSCPKTIGQIHKEAKLQEQQIELNLQKAERARRLGGISDGYFIFLKFFVPVDLLLEGMSYFADCRKI